MTAWTKTQKIIINLLSDGLPHPSHMIRNEIDPQLGMSAVRVHIKNIRDKLPPGQTIICEWHHRQYCYRWIRLLHSSCDGKR